VVEWLPKCVRAVCETCKDAQPSKNCVDETTKDYNTVELTQTDPKAKCNKDVLDYATSACYSELLANCKVTEETLNTCIQDCCAASNAGDPDPLALVEDYCDNQNFYEDQVKELPGYTTTTTTWMGEVDDSSEWTNLDSNSCADYKQNGWCKDGDFVEGFEWKGETGVVDSRCDNGDSKVKNDCGARFNYPSLNCAVCGKDKNVECFEFDINYKGDDIDNGGAKAHSPLACQQLCQADADCKFFLWNLNSENCFFKSATSKKKPSNGRRLVGGAEYCVPPSETPSLDCTASEAPDQHSKCTMPSSFKQCETYGKTLGISTGVQVGALGNEFPKSCFMSTVGTSVHMWWNNNTGDGVSAPDPNGHAYGAGSCCDTSARRICCGAHILPVTPAPNTPPPSFPPNPDSNPADPPLAPYVDKTVVVKRPPNPVSGLCQVYGDPHIVAFDFSGGKSTTVDFFTYGSYWLVKSPAVWIQGHFRSIDLHLPGLAYLTKLAVGGPFLQGNTLMVEGTDSGLQIWWNQGLILQDKLIGTHSEMNGAVVVERSAKGKKNKQQLDVQFPGDVKFSVYASPKRGKVTFLNGVIKMLQVTGQDGQCGNFNGDAADDTKEMLTQRGFADTVDSQDLLIPAK